MKYRLGLDMGATSIGWAVYNIENDTVEDMGIRIFDDGREDKTKKSLCVKRREVRGARRLQNRKRMQKAYLLKTLIQYGLFPKEKDRQQALKNLDVYGLRKKALDEKITLYEFGRVLFQLVQRRGFLSNRKDNREEGGKLKAGYAHLKEKMASENARTYGEYLYNQILRGESPRLKGIIDSDGKFKGDDFPFRELYIMEFETLFEKQQQYYSDVLTSDLKALLKDVLFFQRPLKEAEAGMCTFEYGEKRIAKAHPLFQEFRIWQHIMNLEFCSETESEYRRLSQKEIERLVFILQHPTDYIKTKKALLTYKEIKALLGLDKKGLFNYELKSSKEDDTKGVLADTTAFAVGQVECLRPVWENLSETDKEEIVKIISRPETYIKKPKKVSAEGYDALIIDCLCQRFSLSNEVGKALLYDVEWENGFGALSEKALRKIVEAMKTGMTYDMACQETGYHHSHKETVHRDFLPYYGEILEQSCIGQKDNPTTPEERYGKIANATVHVALNQVRQVVNELIRHYGQPFDISIEYARDLNASAEERQKMSKTRDNNEAENERIKNELFEKTGRSDWTHRDIEKYKIWKNMGVPKGESALNCRECPYTGEKIIVSDLLNGNRFQIEHLIPFSRSLDNSYANRVIASAWANKLKGNKTPYEAFHNNEFASQNIVWAEIQNRIKKLPDEQKWRFGKDAMKKFEEKEGPIARSLNDTRYMTRVLQTYLLPIVREDGYKKAQAVAGQLTAMVRKSWGLNLYKEDKGTEEYRAYHNHHAIDAVIISAVNRGQIEKTAQALKTIYPSALERFRDELYKFKDKDTSEDERKDLRKRIKDFTQEREATIINTYIQKPTTIPVPDLLKRVENINISHKPKLKNVYDKDSTVGQLHEDTAYGFKGFVDEESLTAKFKTGNGNDKKEVIKDVTDYIPMFYNTEDKQAYYDAFKEWFIIERKARTLDAKTSEEKLIKQELQNREKEAVLKLRETSQKAFKWFVGGGNFCAEIYQINPQNKIGGVPTKDAGEWKSEIISNYNATVRVHRGEDIFYWKNRHPNAKRIMTLKRNDMVTGTFTKEEAFEENFPKGIQAYVRPRFEENPNLTQTTVLFRVKKINSNGQIALTPHNIAKEEQDTKSWMATSGSLQKYRAKKVFVSPTGRIQNAK